MSCIHTTASVSGERLWYVTVSVPVTCFASGSMEVRMR
jgi:hypothetical protein